MQGLSSNAIPGKQQLYNTQFTAISQRKPSPYCKCCALCLPDCCIHQVQHSSYDQEHQEERVTCTMLAWKVSRPDHSSSTSRAWSTVNCWRTPRLSSSPEAEAFTCSTLCNHTGKTAVYVPASGAQQGCKQGPAQHDSPAGGQMQHDGIIGAVVFPALGAHTQPASSFPGEVRSSCGEHHHNLKAILQGLTTW